MPYFNVATGNMFPDVVLQKSEGGMEGNEKVHFRIFPPRTRSRRLWPDYFSNRIFAFTASD